MITTRKIYCILMMFSFSIIAFSQLPNNDIKAGEKLFSTLLNSDEKSCKDCHYSVEPDTLNWNPSVSALAIKSSIYDIDGISKYFKNHKGVLMKEVHKGYSLSGDDEKLLIAYISSLDTTQAELKKSINYRLVLFIGLIILLIILWLEKKRIGKIPKVVNIVLSMAVFAVICTIIVQDAIALGRSKNYAPVQPIKFSHTIHSIDNKIECNYCHSGVLKGRNAGIPPVSLCLNCHKHVLEGARSGFFEIAKITQAITDTMPIRWIRIHNLADYTYFNHMQHVKIGGLDCTECHGEVKDMHIVKQVEDLSMGWCINCHDTRAVDFSNDYYKTHYPVFYDSLQIGKIDSVMVSDIGGRDCSKCHY